MHNIEEIFGVNRDLPLNYSTRNLVDDVLVESLSKDRHIVIHGSSKAGKTCLRKKYLNAMPFVSVHCSNKWSIEDLSSTIIKNAGYEVTRSTKQATTGSWKLSAKAKGTAKGSIFLAAVEGEAGFDGEKGGVKSTEVLKEPLELDPSDVNDLILALKAVKAPKWIILEDFHYLPEQTQIDFSVFLKALHENSAYCVVVIGVWLDENRLTRYNGDLCNRLQPISVDSWSQMDLGFVVHKSEQLLNIEFELTFIKELIEFSLGNVYLIQESLYNLCKKMGIIATQQSLIKSVGYGEDAIATTKKIVSQHDGRFHSFVTLFADGFHDTQLEMYKYILSVVIQASPADLRSGLRMRDIKTAINKIHPNRPINTGNITQSLQSMAALQAKKEQKPIILDYDQSMLRLHVVDRSFLMWLEYQNREDLLDLIGIAPGNAGDDKQLRTGTF